MTVAIFSLWHDTVTNFFFSLSNAFEAFSSCWHHNNTKLEDALLSPQDTGDWLRSLLAGEHGDDYSIHEMNEMLIYNNDNNNNNQSGRTMFTTDQFK